MSVRVSIHDELSAGATDALDDVRGQRSKLLEVLFHKKSTVGGMGMKGWNWPRWNACLLHGYGVVINGKDSNECHDDGDCDDGGGGGLEEVTHEFVK